MCFHCLAKIATPSVPDQVFEGHPVRLCLRILPELAVVVVVVPRMAEHQMDRYHQGKVSPNRCWLMWLSAAADAGCIDLDPSFRKQVQGLFQETRRG